MPDESSTEQQHSLPFVTDKEILRELKMMEASFFDIHAQAGSMARRAAALRQKLEPREPAQAA